MLRATLPAKARLQAQICCGMSAMNGAYEMRRPARSHVAVIGAGAAGLVAARELRREGHAATVFEQGSTVGGVWVYTDDTETEDLLGASNDRARVHSSMYKSLRTNLPRHVMAFSDFPFDPQSTSSGDERLYCGHQEVLRYLELFDRAFGISDMIQFNTKVTKAEPIHSEAPSSKNAVESRHGCYVKPRWRLKTLCEGSEAHSDFDALVVCNGHYSDPRVPKLPGSPEFPGLLLHTHNFRENGPFRDQRVVIMGASASGQDVAREIAEVADKVYFSARPMQFGSKQIDWKASDEPFGERKNMVKRAPIQSLGKDSSVTFSDGLRVENIDAVVFATGYKFSFPFLDSADVISVSNNRVTPLFQHLICSSHPSLSFIGLPWQVIPFPLMEFQSKWVARVLSGRIQLPSREQMEQHTADFYKAREAAGIPERYSHRLGEDQWEYNAWLVKEIGEDQPQLPSWRPRMHKAGQANIRERPDSYRDSWLDTEVLTDGELWAKSQRSRTQEAASVA